jgi:hypothetical protein
MWKLFLSLFTLASLSACATPQTVLQTQTVTVLPSEALRQPCKPPFLIPETSPRASMQNGDAWHDAFTECAQQHQRLITALEVAND